MSDTLQEEVVQPVESVEQVYRYQPTDNEGRAIGGLQVIKYTTPDELRDKLVEQNTLLIRKLRQETRKNRLGIQDEEQFSEDTPKYTGPKEFKPRELSDDERVGISRRLLDPTTAFEAQQELIEAQLGAPLAEFGSTLSQIQNENLKLRARVESQAFLQDNPDYYKCEENFAAITGWMLRYDLAPVKDNFQKAYDTLKTQGVLIEGAKVEVVPVVPVASIVHVDEPTAPVREELPVTVQEIVPETVRRLPTGLTRNESSDTGPINIPGSDIVYEAVIGGEIKKVNGVEQLVGAQKKLYTGAAALDAMPAEEYKRRLLHEPGFTKKVQELDKASNRR